MANVFPICGGCMTELAFFRLPDGCFIVPCPKCKGGVLLNDKQWKLMTENDEGYLTYPEKKNHNLV